MGGADRARRPQGGSARREFLAASLLCAAGALTALLAGRQTWASVRTTSPVAAGEPVVTTLTGGDLTATVSALGWAALAGLAALAATRGRVRAVIGWLLVSFGGGLVAGAAGAAGAPAAIASARAKSVLVQAGQEAAVQTTPWWLVAAAGGILVALAGLWTIVRGRRWPGMSSRYDPPGVAAAPRRGDRGHPDGSGPADPGGRTGPGGGDGTSGDTAGRVDAATMWRSLDRGEDPTDAGEAAEHRP
jgi:uncharacterized membrane protein (TIGR02234 family)